MSEHLHSDSPLHVAQVGDVVGVHFFQEDEVTLFLPQSGDVLLCSLVQWRQLTERPVPTGTLGDTLRALGASLDASGQP